MNARRPESLVLGIETSCDDTSVAVLENGVTLRAHLSAAQDVHKLYGGIVPELASRAHLELLPRMVKSALGEANVEPSDLTAIAVTHAPGLVGSLVVGLAFGKAYGAALGIPVIGVNHIEAHLHSATLEHGEPPYPHVALIVSGGHTELVEVKAFGEYRWMGATLDDAHVVAATLKDGVPFVARVRLEAGALPITWQTPIEIDEASDDEGFIVGRPLVARDAVHVPVRWSDGETPRVTLFTLDAATGELRGECDLDGCVDHRAALVLPDGRVVWADSSTVRVEAIEEAP
jgi:hypothetical protein